MSHSNMYDDPVQSERIRKVFQRCRERLREETMTLVEAMRSDFDLKPLVGKRRVYFMDMMKMQAQIKNAPLFVLGVYPPRLAVGLDGFIEVRPVPTDRLIQKVFGITLEEVPLWYVFRFLLSCDLSCLVPPSSLRLFPMVAPIVRLEWHDVLVLFRSIPTFAPNALAQFVFVYVFP